MRYVFSCLVGLLIGCSSNTHSDIARSSAGLCGYCDPDVVCEPRMTCCSNVCVPGCMTMYDCRYSAPPIKGEPEPTAGADLCIVKTYSDGGCVSGSCDGKCLGQCYAGDPR